MWRTSSIAVFGLLLLGVLPAAASDFDLRRFQAAEPHMGTLARITLYARDGEQARRGFESAFQRIRELDEALSDYRPGSELMRLCGRAGEGPVSVSAHLLRVLAAAQDLAKKTDGAFDVTLGPVTHLWREARRGGRPPDPGDLARANRLSGFRRLTVDSDARTVVLELPGMQLDLGGIAKGFAADEALMALREQGIPRALVAIGGDIAIGGPPPGKPGWSIGIELPGQASGKFARRLELHNAAVSTSGDSEQNLEFDGIRHSHIISPAEGRALTNSIAVTVIAERGIDADSLATAVSVMGIDNGLRYIEGHTGAAALAVWREDGQLQETSTSRFPQKSYGR